MSGWKKILGTVHSSFCKQCGAYLLPSDNGDIECSVCGCITKSEGLFLFNFICCIDNIS
jgi:hypothetical protein